MGLFDIFKKKVKPLLSSEDSDQLREIERVAYLNEAKTLVEKRGKEKAKRDLQLGDSN